MFRNGVDRITVRLGRNIGAKLWDPAIEQRPALFAEPLIDNRCEIPQAIDLRDQSAQSRAGPDNSDDVLAAQNVRFAHAQRAQLARIAAATGASTLMLVMKA